MRILLAEDEVTIARALKAMLEMNKYTVDVVHNGNDAWNFISSVTYDALVLDIMMPGMDGIQVLSRARNNHITTPALFLSAKAEVEDRIRGLDAGADDYLPKPFDSGEFLARVRALTRRSNTFKEDIMRFGNTELDGNTYFLKSNSGAVRLNNKEFKLMELFMTYPHQVFSTEKIMDRVWDIDSKADLDVIWTYIGFLRKKLKGIDADIEIKTIRSAGYALEKIA